jgi:hypothetical protein
MLSDKFVLRKAFPATVEALNDLVSFSPREIPPDIRKDSRRDQLERSIRGSKAEIQRNGCSVRANRAADCIFGYGLVGFDLRVSNNLALVAPIRPAAFRILNSGAPDNASGFCTYEGAHKPKRGMLSTNREAQPDTQMQ